MSNLLHCALHTSCKLQTTYAMNMLFTPVYFSPLLLSHSAFWEEVNRDAIPAQIGDEKPSADKGNQEQMGNYLAT